MALLQIGMIEMQLDRKPIKNLYIKVLPPDGRVCVSAPRMMTDTAIRMAVISRIPWIKKQQNNLARQARQSDREMVSGECHYLWGKQYRLNVIERGGRHEVKIEREEINLYVNPGTLVENKALVLTEYYRVDLKTRIEMSISHWQDKIGVTANGWGVKKMKTRWGSCNIGAKRIWLNLELVKKPPECLEYVLVHELVHLLERKHNKRFKAYMDKYLPDWRERRERLNRMPLAYDEWVY